MLRNIPFLILLAIYEKLNFQSLLTSNFLENFEIP